MKTGVITLTMAFTLALAFLLVAGFPPSSEAGSCPDADSDTICDPDDNCLNKANPTQTDTNSDGYGNHCDADWDDNGTVGATDLGIWKVHFGHINLEAQDRETDCSEPPTNSVGAIELGCWKTGFGAPPEASGKSCADPTAPGTCP